MPKTTYPNTAVAIIGPIEAGKTSLIKRMIQGNKYCHYPCQLPTRNIDVHHKLGTPKLGTQINFLDFSGKRAFKHVNHLFMPKDGVYLLVVDDNDYEGYQYFLKNIDAMSGQAKIFVARNKIDVPFAGQDRFNLEKFLQDSQAVLKQGYPNSFKELHWISVKSRKNLNQLKLQLQLAAKRQAQTVRWPESWILVKDSLLENPKPFLSQEEYATVCKTQGITDPCEQAELANTLHNSGTLAHFSQIDSPSIYLMKLDWLMPPMYKIIQEAECKNGKLSAYKYTEAETHSIIQIMKKLDLCYEKDGMLTFPDFLLLQEPELSAEALQDCFHVTLEYQHLPTFLLSSLSARLHDKILYNWRYGVLLDMPTGKAVITQINNDLEVKVIGSDSNKAFQEILACLEMCYQSMRFDAEKLGIKMKLHLPSYPTHTVDYEDLLGQKAMGNTHIAAANLKKDIEISSLLGTQD